MHANTHSGRRLPVHGVKISNERDGWLILLIGGLTFLGYLLVSPTGFSLGDGPELAASAAVLGIPHPPGYPIFINLGHLLTVPLGDGLLGLRLLNTLAVSAAAGFIFCGLRSLEIKRLSAFLGAILFSTSTIAVRGAIFVEVYGVALLCLSVVVWALLRSIKDEAAGRDLLVLAFCYGLALAHHLTQVFLAPAVLYAFIRFARRNRPPVAFYALLAAAGIIGLSVYLYLPIRTATGPAIAWFEPDNLERLRFVLGGASYGEYWGVSGDYFWSNMGLLGEYLLGQFPLYLVITSLIGFILLARRRLWPAILLAAGALANLWWAARYAVIGLEVFLLLGTFTVVFTSVYAISTGIGRLFVYIRGKKATTLRPIRGAVCAAVLLLVVWGFLRSSTPEDLEAHPHGRNLLRCSPNGAVTAFTGDLCFPILHQHYGSDRRPDLVMIDENGMITASGTQRLAGERTVGGAPVLYFDPAWKQAPFPTVRWGYGYLFPPDAALEATPPQRYLEGVKPGGIYADEVAVRYLLARFQSQGGDALWEVLGARAADYAGVSPHGHLALGRWLLDENPAAAREEFQRAVELNPWMPSARYDLALAELALGDVPAARMELEATLNGFAEPEVKARAQRLLSQLR